MAAVRNRIEDIQDFLAHERIALIGLSTHEKHFSRAVDEELRARGYDVVPVHPGAETIDDRPCFDSIADVSPPVAAALVMTPAEQSAAVVEQCVSAGVAHVWLHRGGGPGAVSAEAVAFARAAGLRLVAGECPMMFLPDAAWFHRLHGFGKRLTGSYPA